MKPRIINTQLILIIVVAIVIFLCAILPWNDAVGKAASITPTCWAFLPLVNKAEQPTPTPISTVRPTPTAERPTPTPEG